MLVVLMLKDKLLQLRLPSKISGNYVIKDNDMSYVNVESDDGTWKIKSNKNINILKNQKELYNEVVLTKNSFFPIKFVKLNDMGFIYCTDIYDSTFTQFNISNANELIVSNSGKCNIQYQTNLINKYYY